MMGITLHKPRAVDPALELQRTTDFQRQTSCACALKIGTLISQYSKSLNALKNDDQDYMRKMDHDLMRIMVFDFT